MHSYLGQKRLWRTLAVPWLSIEQFVLKGPFKPTVRNHVEDVICGLQLLNIDRERTSNISENSRKLLATLPSGCAICIQESIIPQSTWLKDLRRSPRLAYNWAPWVVGTIWGWRAGWPHAFRAEVTRTNSLTVYPKLSFHGCEAMKTFPFIICPESM